MGIYSISIRQIKPFFIIDPSCEHLIEALELGYCNKKGTPKGDELEILTLLIEKYEDDNFPIELPDPVEAIKFRMEQLGLTQTDLAEVVGQKSRASEILNRKRKLSLEMIRQLHNSWHIPTEVLIQAY